MKKLAIGLTIALMAGPTFGQQGSNPPGKTTLWLKPEIRMANGNSLRLIGNPIPAAELNSLALDAPLPTAPPVASNLPIPQVAFQYPPLLPLEVAGNTVKCLSGIVTAYPVAVREPAQIDRDEVLPPRDFLVEVSGTLEGEGRDQALYVESHRVLGVARRVEGILEVRKAGKLALRTPEGTLVALVGDQLQFLESKLPDRKDGLQVIGNAAAPNAPPALRLITYRVLPDYAASMSGPGADAGDRIARKAPKRVRGKLVRNRQHPEIVSMDGHRYRLTQRQYDALRRLQAREDAQFELAGTWDGEPESGILQVVSYREMQDGRDGTWVPLRGPALDRFEHRPRLLEGAIVPGPDGRPWLHTTDGRMFRLSGEMAAALGSDPYSRSYMTEVTGYYGGSTSEPELQVSQYRFLSVPISSSPIRQRWSNAAWYDNRPVVMRGRMVYRDSAPPRFETEDGLTIALAGAALGILMNKATAPDGTVELQGVLGGQGTAKQLKVSSFKALTVAPAAKLETPATPVAAAASLGLPDAPIATPAAAAAVVEAAAKPIEPAKPVEVAKPVEAVKPVEAAKSVEAVKPVEVAKPVMAIEPAAGATLIEAQTPPTPAPATPPSESKPEQVIAPDVDQPVPSDATKAPEAAVEPKPTASEPMPAPRIVAEPTPIPVTPAPQRELAKPSEAAEAAARPTPNDNEVRQEPAANEKPSKSADEEKDENRARDRKQESSRDKSNDAREEKRSKREQSEASRDKSTNAKEEKRSKREQSEASRDRSDEAREEKRSKPEQSKSSDDESSLAQEPTVIEHAAQSPEPAIQGQPSRREEPVTEERPAPSLAAEEQTPKPEEVRIEEAIPKQQPVAAGPSSTATGSSAPESRALPEAVDAPEKTLKEEPPVPSAEAPPAAIEP